MEEKFLKNNWIKMGDQINGWWDDLMDEELGMVDGDQEQLVQVLQERYGYARNPAFREIKKRRGYHAEGEGRKNRANNDDWRDSNDTRGFSGARAKKSPQTFRQSTS